MDYLQVISERVVSQAKSKGQKIIKESTKDGGAIILANKHTSKAVLLTLDGTGPADFFTAFSIDVDKWTWAEDEGFSRDDMASKLFNQIFTKIPNKDVIDYLIKN